jgi:hypothetical protein
MKKLYVALHAIQHGRESIEPYSHDGKSSGLYEAEYSKKLEASLIDSGAIRFPTEEETDRRLANVEVLDDSRPIVGEVVKEPDAPKPEPQSQTPTGSQAVDDGLTEKTNAELKALAAAEQIDLGEAKTKAEFVAAIRAGRVAAGGRSQESNDDDLLA